MTHASVFSGIGGPEVAATMLGWENLFHCEINPFGRRVLEYWFPESKSYEDITNTDFREWRGKVDVLTGGFPCQPFSYAGQRRGAEDDRYLWPSMFRCIDEVQPTWVIAENVAGITTMVEQGEVVGVAAQASLFEEDNDIRRYELRETYTLERICNDLGQHGYDVQPILIPACSVGAPHRRDRVFIVARRIASDTDNRADRRTSREDEGRGREERIQERHEVRKPDEPNQVRHEGATIPQDSMHSRQLYGQDEVERSERDIGNVGAGGGERICGETSRTDDAYTEHTRLEGQDTSRSESPDKRLHLRGTAARCGGQNGEGRLAPHPDSHRGCEVDEHMESELADGAKPVSNGGERTSADTSHDGHIPCDEARNESEVSGTTQWYDSELHDATQADGSGRTSTESRQSDGRPSGRVGSRDADERSNQPTEREIVEGLSRSLRGSMSDTDRDRLQRWLFTERIGERGWSPESDAASFHSDGDGYVRTGKRWDFFPSVSPVHRGNDGLPFNVDNLTISFGKWRTESLKAYGNAIVPQVMYEIFRAIDIVSHQSKN